MFTSLRFLFLLSTSILVIVHGDDPTRFAEDEWSESHGRIIFSSAFFRHGDRAPFSQYPQDPYQDDYYWQTYWPQGRSNLSEMGKIQTNNLGKWFRARYNSLIPNDVPNDFIKVDRSEVERTINSAKCFLHGFFYPSKDQTCTEGVLQSEPLVATEFNQMVSFLRICKQYWIERGKVNRSREWLKLYSNFETLFNSLEPIMEIEFDVKNMINGIEKLYFLYDTLHIEALYGLDLPQWTTNVFPNPLREIVKKHLPINVRTHKMQRLRAGPLIGEIVQDMESKIQNQSNTTLHFYAGHENTIATLLDTLSQSPGVYYDVSPSYAATFFVELREMSDTYVVTMSYRDTPQSEPIMIPIPDCSDPCTFSEFKILAELLIPVNWQSECNEK